MKELDEEVIKQEVKRRMEADPLLSPYDAYDDVRWEMREKEIEKVEERLIDLLSSI